MRRGLSLRPRSWITLAAITLAAIAPITQAATFIINVGGANNAFAPQTLTIDVNDTVTFVNKGGFHNVVADDGSFRCARGCDGDGRGGSGNASSANWAATVPFNTAGTVGYFCEIHGMPGEGMFGTIIVNGAIPPPPPPAAIAVPGGNAFFYVLLACALALATALRLKRKRRNG